MANRCAIKALPGRIWLVCGVSACVLSLSSVAVGDALSAAELSARLAAFDPRIPAPPVEALIEAGGALPQARLLGVDLLQGQRPCQDAPVGLDGRLPLEITAYWLSVGELGGSAPIEISFWSHEHQISKAYSFAAGPVAGETPWEPGCAYRQTYTVDMAPVSNRITGKSFLNLDLVSGEPAGRQTLICVPLHVAPLVTPSRMAASALEKVFGAGYRDLAVSFRLGFEAEQTLDVPPQWRTGARAIGLVSSYSYGSIPQDSLVCEIAAESQNGSAVILPVASGVSTARTDYDYYPAGRLDHSKISIAESVEADYLNEQERRFEKHKYAAKLELPADFGPIVRLRFRAVSALVFDVHDVALLPGGNP